MKAMVSTGNALASISGLRVMMEGGNAFDAMVAANAVLQVTSPFVCGFGGDFFALLYEAKTGKVSGFNGSGRAPAALTVDKVRSLGNEAMPARGALTVTVPGCVDAWSQVHARFGTVPWRDLFTPALTYARDGHPAGRSFASSIAGGITNPAFLPSWQKTFAPEGIAPKPGDVVRQALLAESLEHVAQEGRDGLYRGDVAKQIVDVIQAEGGVMTLDDLAAHHGDWVEPVSSSYRGYTVYETAPSSQGLTALIALNLLEDVDLTVSGPGSVATISALIEANKLAYADRDRYLADPAFVDIPVDWLLSKSRVKGNLLDKVQAPAVNLRLGGDTTSYCIVDPEGNCASCIQSNYLGFGSGLAAGGFGLQNRGAYFSLQDGHPNRLEPGKRTLHTLMAAIVMDGNAPWILFGAVGADTQPQSHLQILTNIIDHGMNIQAAIEAPRMVLGGPRGFSQELSMEPRFDNDVVAGLAALGYAPQVAASQADRAGFSGGNFGYGHGIIIDPRSGARFGGADPRWDAYAIGF
jgi:gamma-glutamyltranspeptidase/glutathione hydrolase